MIFRRNFEFVKETYLEMRGIDSHYLVRMVSERIFDFVFDMLIATLVY